MKWCTEECTGRSEIRSSQIIRWGCASEKHDPESRFLCQIIRSIGVNWKSRNAAHTHSSNVFPKDGDFLDNKFSASASSSCRSDFLLISRREESLTIVAGRSTENVSFKESLVLDNSSNVKHERRKPFMQSGSLRRSLTHDESSFDSYEDIKFEKIAEDVNQFCWGKTKSKALQSQNRFRKVCINQDILEEYDHRMDFFEQTAEMYDSVLPYFSPEPRLFCHQISGPGFEMLILTLLKMGLKLLLNMKLVSRPSEFYYEGDDLSLLHSHGVDNLNNYLTPRAMLSSRVDGTRDEEDQKKSFSSSILPKHGEKLSARSFHIYVINLHPSCGDCVFSDERPSMKMKLANIWNNKLQAQRGVYKYTQWGFKRRNNLDLEHSANKCMEQLSISLPHTHMKNSSV
uniref:Uncharacterized protein n=1 Tax=Solanum lycopersicum TaxID=4081 RepID=A0A3Q7FX72_SOLLC